MAGVFEMTDSQLHAYLRTEGLQAAFEPMDARASALVGLWPGPDMSPEQVRQHVDLITEHLTCDTYGGVEAIKWARNCYNERIGVPQNNPIA